MPSSIGPSPRRARDLLAQLAERQEGLVTVVQATGLGIEPTALQREVARGHLERVAPGLLAVAGAPRSWRRDAMASVLLAGPDAVLSHRTAARLWDLRGFERAPIEVTTLRWRRRQTRGRSGYIVHESTDLRSIDTTTCQGLPCTTIVRTFVDLGASAKVHLVEDAFDDAVRRGIVRFDDVLARYRELSRRGRRGCGAIGQILERRDPSAQRSNTFEKLLLQIVRAAGLPEPVAQLRVDGAGWTYFLDFGWPDARLAVECDSLSHHTGLRALQHDDERQNRLVLAGWTVLRFTWDDVRNHPERVGAQIKAALGA